ncbi:hypothetical protein EV424DRAFT_1350853 [Suillus variegatus]|nr:hypothetical protein EV424DRAFT_1350853 [Suillus variegatus]
MSIIRDDAVATVLAKEFQQSLDIQQLNMQWDYVVSCINMVSVFSWFLLSLLFYDLQKATEEGLVIIVNATNADRGKKLQYVAPELAVVAKHLMPPISFAPLRDSDTTVQDTLDTLNHNQWLHLACRLNLPSQCMMDR